jgi:GTP1/Obg family GTP-binding protein
MVDLPGQPNYPKPRRPSKKNKELLAKKVDEATKEFELSLEKAKNKTREKLNQKRVGAINLRYVTERLRDIKNMDEVEAFYKECVYNMGINTLHNGEVDG